MTIGLEEKISSIAVEAMLHEVAATPKPGLVDRRNSGAHRDMDIFTFLSSASTLHPFFTKMALEGSQFNGGNFTSLMKNIRPIGIEAEKSMLRATSGINTHKGLIFSLGILVSATACVMKKGIDLTAETICTIAGEMCRGIVENELHNSNPGATAGERLYRTQGIKGIRGEAEAGFPSVIQLGLPFLRKSSGDWNNRLINTLLHLITIVEDSNVLSRHNRQILNTIQRQIKEVLNKGGSNDERGMEILNQMDLNFIEQNISPGGSADLLAVTIFLYNIELFIRK